MTIGELHHKSVELRCHSGHTWSATRFARVVETITMPSGEKLAVYEHACIEPEKCPTCDGWARTENDNGNGYTKVP